MVPSERALVSYYNLPYADYSSNSTCLSEILDWNFGWGLRTPILGKRMPYGVGYGTVQKSVGEFL